MQKFSYSKNVSYERMKSNIAAINVYFTSTLIHTYTENPEMALDDLIPNLGGSLGLFLVEYKPTFSQFKI
jgi:hypothetical protein